MDIALTKISANLPMAHTNCERTIKKIVFIKQSSALSSSDKDAAIMEIAAISFTEKNRILIKNKENK